MKLPNLLAIVAALTLVSSLSLAQDQAKAATNSAEAHWPTRGWTQSQPAALGLDEKTLSALDNDLANGKFSLVDSFAVYRCGELAFQRSYAHDYGQIYTKEARERGPLNAHLTGWYNYFDPAWHPYYHGTKLHTSNRSARPSHQSSSESPSRAVTSRRGSTRHCCTTSMYPK